uniref:Uncharacterized protein n=1 Tax=Arundo donax TaxID=35708 RepID=A0A0A9EN37_ARUDO
MTMHTTIGSGWCKICFALLRWCFTEQQYILMPNVNPIRHSFQTVVPFAARSRSASRRPRTRRRPRRRRWPSPRSRRPRAPFRRAPKAPSWAAVVGSAERSSKLSVPSALSMSRQLNHVAPSLFCKTLVTFLCFNVDSGVTKVP